MHLSCINIHNIYYDYCGSFQIILLEYLNGTNKAGCFICWWGWFAKRKLVNWFIKRYWVTTCSKVIKLIQFQKCYSGVTWLTSSKDSASSNIHIMKMQLTLTFSKQGSAIVMFSVVLRFRSCTVSIGYHQARNMSGPQYTQLGIYQSLEQASIKLMHPCMLHFHSR